VKWNTKGGKRCKQDLQNDNEMKTNTMRSVVFFLNDREIQWQLPPSRNKIFLYNNTDSITVLLNSNNDNSDNSNNSYNNGYNNQ
jgi:hypothetical protein